MSKSEENEPPENLLDRLRALFGFQAAHRKDALPPKTQFSIWYFLIAVLAFSYMQQYFFSGKVETIPYSQFKQYVAQGNLASLVIGPEVISGARSELLDRLAVLLGGRVAEELVFNEISTGAQNDLQRATDIARSMVTEYGMSDRMGLVTYERSRQPMFLPGNFSQSNTYSEEKAAQIDGEIARFVDEAHQQVKRILSERRKILDELAGLLSEKESVQGEELRKMLSDSGGESVN
jgi:hypothetical protein